MDGTIGAWIGRIAAAEADGMRLLVKRRAEPGGAWFPAPELLESDGSPAVLLSRIRGVTEVPAGHIRAEWLFESYVRVLGELGAAFILSVGRLPKLSPDNLLMASRNGLIAGVALRSELMDEPVPDGGAGSGGSPAESLRESPIELIGPFAAWFDRHGLRPEKTLWMSAADRIAKGRCGPDGALGETDAAAELLADLLGEPGRLSIPLETLVDTRGVERHRRVTCCLAYRAAGGSLCFACPIAR